MKASFTLLILITLNFAFAGDIPEVQLKGSERQVSLAGTWAFIRGEYVPLDRLTTADWQLVTLPNYLDDQLSGDEPKQNAPRYGTYALRISGIAQTFSQPFLDLRGASDAFEVWWIEATEPPKRLIQNGVIATERNAFTPGHRLGLIPLPTDSTNGLLIIYSAAFITPRSGFIGDYHIAEYDDVRASVLFNFSLRTITTGVGFFIILQSMFFYYLRRSDPQPLLLGVFTLVLVLRSILASEYFDFFMRNSPIPELTLRAEYLSALWAAIAIFHYTTAKFLKPFLAQAIKGAYGVLAIMIVLYALLPLYTVAEILWLLQSTILIFAAFAIAILVRSTLKKEEDIGLFLLSAFPLIIGMLHDIYATLQPEYNLLISEYALFVFLIIQSLLQTRQFIQALKISDNLNEVLQEQVSEKTAELQATNEELIRLNVRLKQRHQQVKLKAEMDHLTGLFNRATFDDHANALFQTAQEHQLPLTVILIDIDHFKQVNDTYGHLIGDECLVYVASLLRGYQFRRGDVVARFGGEEFIVALNDATIEHGVKIAQWLCRELPKNSAASVNDNDIFLTASFGVADLAITDAENLNDLLKAADDALYKAKANGRNRVESA